MQKILNENFGLFMRLNAKTDAISMSPFFCMMSLCSSARSRRLFISLSDNRFKKFLIKRCR